MAKKEIIVARLPQLIADRTDPLKLETAIRYVGDIIFDASQDPDGDIAAWLAEVLRDPHSPEEAQVRDAILILYSDGSLERYADYPALADIARLTEPFSEPANPSACEAESPLPSDSSASATGLSPVISNVSVEAEDGVSRDICSPHGHQSIVGASTENEPTRVFNTTSETPPGDIVESSEVGEVRHRIPRDASVADQGDGTDAANDLEIGCVGDLSRDPFEFADEVKRKSARDLTEPGFTCLARFAPTIFRSEGCVAWKDSAAQVGFRHYGDRLVCKAPSSQAVRAMLEVARAANWARVQLTGSIPVEALIAVTRANLETPPFASPLPRNASVDEPSQTPTKILSTAAGLRKRSAPASLASPKRRALRMTVGLTFLAFLAAAGFASAYVYSAPEAAAQLRAGHLLNALPWRVSAFVRARRRPLKFSSLSLALRTTTGGPLSLPKQTFTNAELSKAGGLKWIATFKNQLAGWEDRKEKVSARFFNQDGALIADTSDEQTVSSNEQTVTFSGIAPDIAGPPGTYRVVLSSGNESLGQQEFEITKHISAKAVAGPAPTPPAIAPREDAELVFWRSIENSKDPQEYIAYLKQYPSGRFARLAKVRVEEYSTRKRQASSTEGHILKPIRNYQLSSSLNSYLHHHRLPYVDAVVRSDRTGALRSVQLSGLVATEHGKQDAESKARYYLNAQEVSINNRIRVDPALLSDSTGAIHHHQGIPSTVCLSRCERTYGSCTRACLSQMTAESGAAEAGSLIPSIIGESAGNRAAAIGVYAGAGTAAAASDLAESTYQACASRCRTQQSSCTGLCR